MGKKLTTEEFIAKAREVHEDKYDYSKVEYINNHTKVCIICPIHGEFWQRPNDHISKKKGCPYCFGNAKLNTDKFIEKAKVIHGDMYEYSKVKYINNSTKVCITCYKHGEFMQSPDAHLRGQGCPKCQTEKQIKRQTKGFDYFINKAKLVHGNKYDYSKAEYVNSQTKIRIICKECGNEFWQKPNNHLNNHGCPNCKHSKGESIIEEYLKLNGIKFISQYKIKLTSKIFSRNNIRVDFYLPEYNTIIEFNGIQHYEYKSYFYKDKDELNKQIERDERLKKYCILHNIKLIVIKYNEITETKTILNKKLKVNGYENFD